MCNNFFSYKVQINVIKFLSFLKFYVRRKIIVMETFITLQTK